MFVSSWRLTCNMTYLGHTVTWPGVTWGQILKLAFEGYKHMDRSSLARGTWWCQNYSPSLSSWEVIHEKTFSKKTYFFHLATSRTYSIRLTANRRTQIDSGDPGLSFCYLTILLASIVIEIIATFCENSPILRKLDLFYPCDLKFDLIKKWSEYFL